MQTWPDLVNGSLNYTAIALYALKRIPAEVVRQLRAGQRYDDVRASAIVAAVEAFVMKDPDFRTAYNRAQRHIYAALKAEGYRRQSQRHGTAMQYQCHEIPYALLRADGLTNQTVRAIIEMSGEAG